MDLDDLNIKLVADTWAEMVWFAECPHCAESVELGADVSWHAGDEAECSDCGKGFVLSEQRP